MKILQVSNKIPYPEKDGGVIGISVFTQSLIKAGCEVKMLAMNTSKQYIDINTIPVNFREAIGLETVDVDNSVKPFQALLALLSGKSYNISRFESLKFGQKLSEILRKEEYDVIQLESIYVAPYIDLIRKHSHAALILRAHNVEWKIWQRLAEESGASLKKWYLGKLAEQLKRYESSVINLCDGITTTTAYDMNILKNSGCQKPIEVIPFGIDIGKYSVSDASASDALFYIGALDWLPNLQGLDWFLLNAWPIIHSKFPEIKFHVAGRNMPVSLSEKHYPGVIFHGEVENAISFMQQYNIMLVPLLAGSGIRVKIIEGMALAKPIVTTSIGMEGIECVKGKDILVDDTAEEFAHAVCTLLIDKECCSQLALNGKKFVSEHHDINKITQQLLHFYNTLTIKI